MRVNAALSDLESRPLLGIRSGKGAEEDAHDRGDTENPVVWHPLYAVNPGV